MSAGYRPEDHDGLQDAWAEELAQCKKCFGKGYNDEFHAVAGHYNGGETFRMECEACDGGGVEGYAHLAPEVDPATFDQAHPDSWKYEARGCAACVTCGHPAPKAALAQALAPLTDAQIDTAREQHGYNDYKGSAFFEGARWAEQAHGIGAEVKP